MEHAILKILLTEVVKDATPGKMENFKKARYQSSDDRAAAARHWNHTKSIVDDLAKEGTSNVFSEASRRTIKELGNVELFELGEISKTVHGVACLRC